MATKLKRPRYSLHDEALRKMAGTYINPLTGEKEPPLPLREGVKKPNSHPALLGGVHWSRILWINPLTGYVQRAFGGSVTERRGTTPTRRHRPAALAADGGTPSDAAGDATNDSPRQEMQRNNSSDSGSQDAT